MATKTLFFCTDCGNESIRWAGQCSACGAWNTLVEEPVRKTTKGRTPRRDTRRSPSRGARTGPIERPTAKPLHEVIGGEETRWKTGRSEEHTSELQSRGHLVCRLLLDKQK